MMETRFFFLDKRGGFARFVRSEHHIFLPEESENLVSWALMQPGFRLCV